jgi:ribonuclease HI
MPECAARAADRRTEASLAKKFYVVWVGRKKGVFTDWEDARAQVHGFAGARFQSFPTRGEAEQALAAGPATRAPAVARKTTVRTPAAADANTFDLQIYCDGACEPNPGNAGSGIVVYRDGVPVELWYGLYNPHGTNNTAELNALHHALLMAEQAILTGEEPQILCDSRYAISCVTVWAEGWEKKGWRKAGGEIKNLEIIQESYALYQRIQSQVQVVHVSAHVGTEGNELADRMAMYAVQSREKELRRYPGPINVADVLRMRAG